MTPHAGGPRAYEPAPLDTSGVALPDSLRALSEALAKNAHEVWSRRRLQEGWRYGPERHDARKEHPCLVPYEQLPESEQQYDREMALATLKVILAMGYRIERGTREGAL